MLAAAKGETEMAFPAICWPENIWLIYFLPFSFERLDHMAHISIFTKLCLFLPDCHKGCCPEIGNRGRAVEVIEQLVEVI
jgi:hypothetical protein